MRNTRSLISVIIPVFNGEIFIAEAIKNIQQQRYHPLEIIIIDDGSTDNTAKVIAHCKADNIYYCYQNNSGPAMARNAGLRIAQGDIIAFQDVDDLWSSNKLELQFNHLMQNSANEVIVGQSQKMILKNSCKGLEFIEHDLPNNYYLLPSALIKKSVFEKIGYFDEELLYCEDLEWFERAWLHNINIKIYEEIVHYYRHHANNMTNNTELKNKYLLKAARKLIEMGRQSKREYEVK